MAISRSDLLKQIMPGLNALFDLEYSKYTNEITNEHKHEIRVDFDGKAISNTDDNGND